MHPISIVVAVDKAKPSCLYVGFDAGRAEEIYERARAEAKVAQLALIQNASPRLRSEPVVEAAAIADAKSAQERQEAGAREAQRLAAQRRLEQAKAELAAAEKALKDK